MNDYATLEWEAWRRLCELLYDARAVTPKDLGSPQNARPTTDGTRLIAAIREWGDAFAKLKADSQLV